MTERERKLLELEEKEQLIITLIHIRNAQKEIFDMTEKELQAYNDDALDELNAIRQDIKDIQESENQ